MWRVENTVQENSPPPYNTRFLNITMLLWEIYPEEKKIPHMGICICVCVCISSRAELQSLPHPSLGLKVLLENVLAMPQRAWWFQFYSTEHNDSQTFLSKSRWKYATSYQHPSSGQCFDLKSFLRNETSPQKSIGDPYFCDWDYTALRQESLSVNWLTQMSCRPSWSGKPELERPAFSRWLRSQMWQWPWWPTSNQAWSG